MKALVNFKAFTVLMCALFMSVAVMAQDKPASPHKGVKGEVAGSTITIRYGSPYVKGRKIWGGLVPYNKVWRAGANEATTFTTDQTIHIEGQLLPAGEYGFFLIPGETKWVVIFNRVYDQWGAYDYDKNADILRVEVKPKTLSTLNERLVYKINADSFSMIWENLEVPVSVK